ncbi:hypothetical protein GCM10025858_23090 [Alicyclobacillus sacchari]|uniref:extracellular solute-binding protein n=1 Tax=Alicyclobacillus sacchari TaxID=392010 RepID=UPI0023E9C737|nr:extracellular solute-binding protein [Alicyclobacillus sacchari]GMA57806.1 hypothetical protein GCM10025858_23090 [Alicyclobacillus sacchari]
MKRRAVCIGSSIALACVGLSGCATNSQHVAPQTSSHQQGEASTVKQRIITVAYQQFGNPPYFNQEWLQQAAQQFEKKYRGVTVKLEPIEASENDFYTKIDLMMKSASTAPDVVTEDTFLINADGSAATCSR